MEDLLEGGTVERSPAEWRNVLERLTARDMPPPKRKERPTEAEYCTGEERVRSQLLAHGAQASGAKVALRHHELQLAAVTERDLAKARQAA